MAFLQPDAVFPRVSAIDLAADITARGLRTVLLDIDNTVRSRADGQVPPDVRRWIAACRQAQVRVCLLSNNWHGDVFDLAASLDLPIVAKALKPLPSGYLAALHTMRAKARHTVVVGDQLFTDIAGARMLGLHAYLVAPLAPVDLPHMAALRRVERAMLGKVGAPAPEPLGKARSYDVSEALGAQSHSSC